MTIAYWCILIAGLMPYLWTGIAKASGAGRYDNADPRAYLAGQSGRSRRADAAQHNAFEAFGLFAAAVLVGHQVGADQSLLDGLALAFIGCRLVYGIAYILDWAAFRSLVWLAGIGCSVAIFVISA